MTETNHDQNTSKPAKAERRPVRWDALAAIIASFVGLLALVIAGYTAYIQRYTAEIQMKQVQAQVWPYLILGNNDLQSSLEVFSKGVGPAMVKSVQFRVDGKPQHDWEGVLNTLGLSPHGIQMSVLANNVLSPGSQMTWIKFQDATTYKHLMGDWNRFDIHLCYCSALGDCWMTDLVSNQPTKVGAKCPALNKSELFRN